MNIKSQPSPISLENNSVIDLNYSPLFIKHLSLVFLNLPSPLHYLSIHFLSGRSTSPIYTPLQNHKNRLHLFITTSGQLAQHYTYISLLESGITNQTMMSQLFNLSINKYEFCFEKNDEVMRANFIVNVLCNLISEQGVQHFLKQSISILALKGLFYYKNEKLELHTQGYLFTTKYLDFPFLSVSFYMRLIVEVDDLCICFQQIQYKKDIAPLQKVTVTNLKEGKANTYRKGVTYSLFSVHPKIKNLTKHDLYIPKEYQWKLQIDDYTVEVNALSKKDIKLGFAQGITDSAYVDVIINQKKYERKIGYVEYIDSRGLILQESKESDMQKILPNQSTSAYLAKNTVKTIKKT